MGDRHNEKAGLYDRTQYTNIKCKNFAICQQYIPVKNMKECDQGNGTYLCPNCFHELNKEEI